MNPQDRKSALVCAAVGNSSLQVGRFAAHPAISPQVLPAPLTFTSVPIGDAFAPPQVDDACRDADWVVTSVNGPVTEQLRAWATRQFFARSFVVLHNEQFPIRHRIAQLVRVGSDRLAAAVAANQLRSPQRCAIFVDAGTAVTVNALATDGLFLGGAILPGMGSSLRALAKYTDQLPLVELNLAPADPPPQAIGDRTEAAIRAGVYWGLVGATRELIQRMSAQLPGEPQIFVTGGFGVWLARELGAAARYEPHLVLSGIAITASDQQISPNE